MRTSRLRLATQRRRSNRRRRHMKHPRTPSQAEQVSLGPTKNYLIMTRIRYSEKNHERTFQFHFKDSRPVRLGTSLGTIRHQASRKCFKSFTKYVCPIPNGSSRLAAVQKCENSRSTPMNRRPHARLASPVVPLPAKGSITTSSTKRSSEVDKEHSYSIPALEYVSTRNCIRRLGLRCG